MQKLATIIDKLWATKAATPKSLSRGNRINPLHILKFSSAHPGLDLQKEELMLACFENAEQPYFLLTEQHLFISDDGKESLSIPLVDAIGQEENYQKGSFLLADEASKAFLKEVLKAANAPKPSQKTLDDFLEKYKNLLNKEEDNYENEQLNFDGKYLEMLSQESQIAVDICKELNADKNFINALNTVLGSAEVANDGYTANHLLLQDLIKAYKAIVTATNPKAQFTLAYLFEKLQGNDLGKGITIERLNQLSTEASFQANIEKIKEAVFIQLPENYRQEYVLPSLLARLEHPLFDKTGNFIYHFASILAKADKEISEEEKEVLKEILRKVRTPQKNIQGVQINQVAEDDSLEKVLQELNDLIGLEEVKKAIADLTNFLKIQKVRIEQGLKANENTLHAVFTGPPGTGKTTVARLLSRIYKHLGYLSSGHLIETDRSGLVAGYVGQTAIRVTEVVAQAKGGLLFVDEAYSLVQEDGGRDFGKEAIETLLKKMEDLRDDFVVVAAGYSEPMKIFINSNPGLRSRFSRYYEFKHFLPTQMMEIFKLYCKKSDFLCTAEAEEKLMEIFDRLYERRDDGFGNARVVRNIFEKITEHQANRLVNIQPLTKEILMNILEEDVPEVNKTVEEVFAMQN